MIKQDLTYWVTLALMPKIWTRRKNEIYVQCFNREPRLTIAELFDMEDLWASLGLTVGEAEIFREAREQLAGNSFLVEDMISQGYDIIPLHSDEYPQTLKQNLGTKSPTVLFTKGNKALLREASIAIVGSRKADETSLRFTDCVARKAAAENKIVVSGFAKGVDRQALDSVLDAGGKSIIVLPQGIMTFASGFKQYFGHIADGRLLVLSTFAPKAPWSVEFAMARNSTIYGMAGEIFVAQSESSGGTWSGATEGLKKNRPIYVRRPEPGERNANALLIEKGAAAVGMNGEPEEMMIGLFAEHDLR